MLTGSDLSEILTDFMIKPLGANGGVYRRTGEAAKKFVHETYAANFAAETLPAVRMLSWNDLPAAVRSMRRYPTDLGVAQFHAWLAWLNFVEKQCTLLHSVALMAASPSTVQRLPDSEPAATVDHKVVPLAVSVSKRNRTPRHASAGM